MWVVIDKNLTQLLIKDILKISKRKQEKGFGNRYEGMTIAYPNFV